MLDNNNNNDVFINEEKLPTDIDIDKDNGADEEKVKPHVIRRSIEDYLEQKALAKRLQDVFDDDFLLD